MGGKAWDGIKAFGNRTLRGFGKIINGFTQQGINWILGKIGVDTKIPKWDVPQYANGTRIQLMPCWVNPLMILPKPRSVLFPKALIPSQALPPMLLIPSPIFFGKALAASTMSQNFLVIPDFISPTSFNA